MKILDRAVYVGPSRYAHFPVIRLRLDLGALEWRQLPDFPAARQSMQALVVGKDDDRALVLGGFGFSGARFGDGELAAEVTRRGRELLQALIGEFAQHGCTILEADTDGIYLSSEEYFANPDALLALVAPILPEGI